MVVDARAFGSHTQRNTLKEHQPGLADRLALVSLIALSLAVFLIVVLHIGNRHI